MRRPARGRTSRGGGGLPAGAAGTEVGDDGSTLRGARDGPDVAAGPGRVLGLDVDEVTAETVISGLVHEDDDLHELLAKVQSLGLHVVSVQQVAP